MQETSKPVVAPGQSSRRFWKLLKGEKSKTLTNGTDWAGRCNTIQELIRSSVLPDARETIETFLRREGRPHAPSAEAAFPEWTG